MSNLQYYGDVNLVHGGSFASKDEHGYHIMRIEHLEDSRAENAITVERFYVWTDDIEEGAEDNVPMAEWCGMDVSEYEELPEFVRAIDHTLYFSQDSDNWTILLPYDEDPYFYDDDNETILAAIAKQGIGMNEQPVSPEWEQAMSK